MRKRLILVLILILNVTLLAQRTRLRPGRNMFSPQQDIEMGREVAKEAEQELVLIKNNSANAYIDALGQQIVAKSPNENKFPFTFKIVDDKSINAFALPGGPVFVHRGAIEAADNEAQLAGVMGHEIGHVILRHGTNQVTKAQLAQAPSKYSVECSATPTWAHWSPNWAASRQARSCSGIHGTPKRSPT
jgi:predicted Zn-dependent protease